MHDHANVQSIEVIREFRGKLIDFIELGQRAMDEAEFDIQRTLSWLQHQQLMHWKHEVKRRGRAVEQCKSELFRAQVSAQQSGGSAQEEAKALRRAEERVAEAEHKVETVKKWARVLDREMTLYKGQCGQLHAALAGEIPKAAGLLDAMADNLDAYVRLTPPDQGPVAHATDRVEDNAAGSEGDDA